MTLSAARLVVESTGDPVAVEVRQPALGWILQGRSRNDRQTAYEIIVASRLALLRHDRANVWKSGRVVSDISSHVMYDGPQLHSRGTYHWKVRVWDGAGRRGPWSPPGSWRMGLLELSDWQARWIFNSALDSPCVVPLADLVAIRPQSAVPEARSTFVREFDVPASAVIEAAMFAGSGNGWMQLALNGQPSRRSYFPWQPWQADLTGDLRRGPNRLEIRLPDQLKPILAGRLVVRLTTGPDIEVDTDEAWTVSPEGSTTAVAIPPEGDDIRGLNLSAPAPSPCLRRVFEIDRTVRRATLYATALGLYDGYLNGVRVGADRLAPGWTDYRQRVQYQTYDVTQLITEGPNCLAFVLGDGWYAGHVGIHARGQYGREPKLLVQLEVEFADETRETIVTDGTWRVSDGAVRSADLLNGEVRDARCEPTGWLQPDFDDRRWAAAVVDEASQPRLVSQSAPPLTVIDERASTSIRHLDDGRDIVDFGQNLTGWLRLRIAGQAGTTISIRHAEAVGEDGGLYVANLRNARQTDRFTLSGSGTENLEPAFTAHGFRYAEISGSPRRTAPADVRARVVHAATPRRGAFETSNGLINRLQANIEWSQLGNSGTIPSDCPQRDERLGWTGDAVAFIGTAVYNFDVASLYTKWLEDLAGAQLPSGAYPDVAPDLPFLGAGTAGWGDAAVVVPWTLYRAYGDRRVLERHYAGMVRWMEYLERLSTDFRRPAEGYGDWLELGNETPKDLVATAWFARSSSLMQRIALALGRVGDARRWRRLSRSVSSAFAKAYVDPRGRLEGDSQGGYVLALAFGLVPAHLGEAATNRLVAAIDRDDGRLATGFLSTGYLLPVLADNGHLDIAYRLLLERNHPSWLYSVRHGATTMWERWNSWTEDDGFADHAMNSFNHAALGSVGEFLYSAVGGLAPDEDGPGWKRIIVRPRPGGDLAWARTSVDTVHGVVAAAWERDKNQLSLEVTIPSNTRATVHVPTREPRGVTEGGIDVASSSGIRVVEVTDDSLVLEVGSGRYEFLAASE
ncbi:MAG: family 78 glycoside hydrolase catalytic domain [Chloroflexi bacterium]|nr:family 78 glycoside hydrolase catalytic domain [Chloroflexota bacterium]